MARFNGTPVTTGPRFSGEPVGVEGKHLSFEEGQRLLDQEDAGSSWGKIGAALTGTLDGLPVIGPAVLGGTERAAAGIASVIDGESYLDNLKQGQNAVQNAQDANPLATIAGNVAGGVLGTAPLVAAAPAAFGISAASVPARAITAGLSGGALGAADGAVRGGTEGAMWGAGLGAGLGAAGPIVGNAAGAAYRNVASRLSQGEAARIAGTSRPAVDVVARGLAADNAQGAVNQSIRTAGPEAMLADAGPSTLSMLDTAIQRAGPGAGEAAQRIGARSTRASQSINNALDTALGPDQGTLAPLADLRRQTSPITHEAYHGPNGAYAQPIDYADPRGQALEAMVRNRVPGGAIQKANELMRINGEESRQIMARVADDGTVTFETLPDVRQIDYMTRALRQTGQRGDGKGAMGGNTAEGRAYMNLATQMRNVLGGLVPEYRAALNTAADPIGRREAREFGRSLLRSNVPRDEADEFIAGLSQVELQDLRGGVRADVGEALANVKRSITDPNVDARQGITALKQFSSDAARHKINAILPPGEAATFLREIDQAARSFEIRAGVATNSRTYGRQAAERAVEQANAPSIAMTAASGRPVMTMQSIMESLSGTGKADTLARQDAAWGEIANLLTQPAGRAGGTFMQALQNAARAIPGIDRRATGISDLLTRGASSLAPQGGRPMIERR